MVSKKANCKKLLNVFKIVFSITLLLSLVTGCGSSDQSAEKPGHVSGDPFKIGIALGEITPETGSPHYRGVSTGADSPLYAKAIVFSQGDTRGALVLCDLIRITRELSIMVRERASKETGIPYQNISIAATHVHTGPRYMFEMQEYSDRLAEGKLTEDDKSGYLTLIIDGITKAIVEADKQVRETEFVSGIGEAYGLSFNRRFLMTNGRVRFNPGTLNPKIVKPAGPIDPKVHFLLFRPAGESEYSSSLTVFANHTDTYGGTQYCADYPYFLQQSMKEIFGEHFISAFGNGTCGNLNHIDVTKKRQATEKGMITKKIGAELAKTIQDNLDKVKPGNPDLEVISKTLYLPLQDYTKEEYEWASDENAAPMYSDREWIRGRRRSKILSLEQYRKREAVQPAVSGEPWRLPVELHVFRLDSRNAIVTLPGEVFVELGLEIKKHSPFENTMVIEMSNINIHYVPDLKGFAEDDYEAMNSRLAPGSGEKMVEEALVMLNQSYENISK